MRSAHTNIVSKDWKKPAQFYIDVFGGTVKQPERKLSGQWLGDVTGLTNAELEGAHLLLPGHGENGPALEILTYAATDQSDWVMAHRIGLTHVAFEVKDVVRTFDKALKKGAATPGKVTVKAIDGVGRLKLVCFRDPDGSIVENQFRNSGCRRLG